MTPEPDRQPVSLGTLPRVVTEYARLCLHTARMVPSARALLAGWRYGAAFEVAEREAAEPEPAPPGWLEDYFEQHATGPGIWKWRHYFPAYERHLGRFRDRPVKVLEIGVFSGGSLGMWRSYFGSQATIYGVDLEPACRAYEDERTRIFIGDQASPSFWEGVLAEIHDVDIVIDDGGHRANQQIRTLEALLPHLNPGGVYICEDIHTRSNVFLSYVDALGRNLHKASSARAGRAVDLEFQPARFQRYVDSVHAYPYLVVIEMRPRPLERLVAPKRGDQWQPFLNVSLPN